MRRARAALLVLCLAAASALAQDASLPEVVAHDFASLRRVGDARFEKLWMHVYDATLWTADGRAPGKAPFALDLRYAMRLSSADIAARSVEEIRRLHPEYEERLEVWGRAMRRIFPDVGPGDRLVGVAIPGREARFYAGDRYLGKIPEAPFVDAFFGIWLDERTSEPALRRELLRGAP